LGREAGTDIIVNYNAVNCSISIGASLSFGGVGSSTSSVLLNVGASVQIIPGWLFYENKYLTNVNIAEGVKDIGYAAFFNCDALSNINLPSSLERIMNQSFYSCDGLKNIEIPSGSIFEAAFCECNGLTSVVIGDGVTAIGQQAFYCCDNLTNVTIGRNVTTLDARAFENMGYSATSDIVINYNATKCTYAFCTFYGTGWDNEVPIIINIGANVEEIPENIFVSACDNIVEVKFATGSQCTKIGANAFEGCTSAAIDFNGATFGWYVVFADGELEILEDALLDTINAGKLLSTNYVDREWHRVIS